MTEKFAKLFEDEKYGQILVMRDKFDDAEPCVKFMARLPGLDVCAVAVQFTSDANADRAFAAASHEQARSMIADMWAFGGEERQ